MCGATAVSVTVWHSCLRVPVQIQLLTPCAVRNGFDEEEAGNGCCAAISYLDGWSVSLAWEDCTVLLANARIHFIICRASSSEIGTEILGPGSRGT